MSYGAFSRGRKFCLALILSVSAVQADTVTIAALGDSLTQGYGLIHEDGFVPQLQEWLTTQGVDVNVINAGVSGDTTAGGLSRVAWTLTPEVDAMIVALGGNDLLRGIDPTVSQSNLDGILEAAVAANVDVLLVGMEAPLNFGADYKAAFDGMYPILAEKYGVALYPAFFDGLLAQGPIEEVRARYMQRDGIHPNAQGVAVIVDAMGSSVLELID